MGAPWTTRDGQAIGAWVFKANPDVFDALAHFEKYGEFTTFAVRSSYRLGLVEPGQPALLWITAGKGGSVPPGFYAAGEILNGGFFHGIGAGEGWTEEGEATGQDLFVHVRLRPLVEPILKPDVVAKQELARIEPVRAPQMANPSLVLATEWELIGQHFNLATTSPTQEQMDASAEQQELVDAMEHPILELYRGDDVVLSVTSIGDDDDFELLRIVDDPADPDREEVTTFSKLDDLWADSAGLIDPVIAVAQRTDADATAGEVFDRMIMSLSPTDQPLVIVRDASGGFRLLDPVERDDADRPADRGTFADLLDAVWAGLDILAGTDADAEPVDP